MNEYALIRKNEEGKKIYTVKCEDFDFEKKEDDFLRFWGGEKAIHPVKNYHKFKREWQAAFDNYFYIEEGTKYCIQNLEQFFRDRPIYQISDLESLVGKIDIFCKERIKIDKLRQFYDENPTMVDLNYNNQSEVLRFNDKKNMEMDKNINASQNINHPFFDNAKDYMYLVLKAEIDDEEIYFVPSFLENLFNTDFTTKFEKTIDFLYEKSLLSSKQQKKVIDIAHSPRNNEFYLNYKTFSFQIKIIPACRIRIDGYPLSVEGVEYYNNNYKKANNDVMTNYQSALQMFLGDKAIITTLKN